MVHQVELGPTVDNLCEELKQSRVIEDAVGVEGRHLATDPDDAHMLDCSQLVKNRFKFGR